MYNVLSQACCVPDGHGLLIQSVTKGSDDLLWSVFPGMVLHWFGQLRFSCASWRRQCAITQTVFSKWISVLSEIRTRNGNFFKAPLVLFILTCLVRAVYFIFFSVVALTVFSHSSQQVLGDPHCEMQCCVKERLQQFHFFLHSFISVFFTFVSSHKRCSSVHTHTGGFTVFLCSSSLFERVQDHITGFAVGHSSKLILESEVIVTVQLCKSLCVLRVALFQTTVVCFSLCLALTSPEVGDYFA